MTQRLALGIWGRLISLTPVDTGWARFHWILSWEQPDSRRPGTPPEGTESNAIPPPQINIQRPGDFPNAFIQNRVPYIKRLNEGWSTKAPANFVENAINAEMAVLRSSDRRGPYDESGR